MSRISEPTHHNEDDPSGFGFSLEEMRKGVRSGTPLEWLHASWSNPAAFHSVLWRAMDKSKVQRSKTQLFSSYALYHDLLGRHRESTKAALVHHEPSLGWQTLRFSALEKRSRAMASRWQAAGVQAGSRVVLLLPMDAEWLTTFFCALRIGCRICWIPPRGKSFVHNRMRTLEFDWVFSPKRYAAYIAPWQDRRLEAPFQDSTQVIDDMGAHAYAPEEAVLDVFSSASGAAPEAQTVSAEALYLGMLRDATLLLELNANDRVMLPDFGLLQHLPNHLLTTLLAGATFVQGDLSLLQNDEGQQALWPTVVGVSPVLRDQVRAGDIDTKSWRLCHWNPGMPFDWQAWEDFVRRMQADGTAAVTMNFAVSAAAGGSVLWSTRQGKRMPLSVLPAPGVPWELRDMTATDQIAQGGTGVYMPSETQVPLNRSAGFLLSRFADGYVFSGSHQPLTNGVPYPSAEVIELIGSSAEANGASVVSQLVSEPLFQHENTLLVFVDEALLSSQGEKALQDRYTIWLTGELGEGAKPDRIRFLPLYAKRDDNGDVDHDWCRTQFLDGSLERKSQDDLFRELGRLRRVVDLMNLG